MDATDYIVVVGNGTARSRSIRRLPMENRWNRDSIVAIRSTPQNQFVAPEMKATFPEGDGQHQPMPEHERPRVRRLKIIADQVRILR